MLLRARADPARTDSLSGESALMEAACRGDAELCSLLLGAAADPLQKNFQGLAAWQLADELGQRGVVALLRGEEPTGPDAGDGTARVAAYRAADSSDDDDDAPDADADADADGEADADPEADTDNVDAAAESQADADAGVEATEVDGPSAPSGESGEGGGPKAEHARGPAKPMSLRAAVKAGSAEAVRGAVDRLGANAVDAMDAVDATGRTVLHICAASAALYDAADIARLLLESRAHVDAPDAAGRTPLGLAVAAGISEEAEAWAALDTIRVLLVAGASPGAVREWGEEGSALRAADGPAGRDICKLLQAFGAELPWLGTAPDAADCEEEVAADTEEALAAQCTEHGVPLEQLGASGAGPVLAECRRWRGMGIRDLRAECDAERLPTEGCVEKADLVARLRQAARVPRTPPRTPASLCDSVTQRQ